MELLADLLSRPSPLSIGEVHLWLLDINQFNDRHLNQAQEIMSLDEHKRAQRFVRGKQEYIASRWLLRRALGQYLQESAPPLKFAREEKGKPYIPGTNIQFNLSHSGTWAVLAVAKDFRVGIDVEQGSNARDLLGIATNYYHPDELRVLEALPPDAQLKHFYRLWTLKEALLKAAGAGISAGLENLNFSLGTEISVEITAPLATAAFASNWHFHQWQLSDGSFCALASACETRPHVSWFDAIQALN